MQVREPVVAGQFYPAERDICLREITECITSESSQESLPESIVAGIVPHAGWTFSGPLAASVFSAVQQRHEAVETFVILGSAHSYFGPKPAVDTHDGWGTPLGDIPLDRDFREQLLDHGVVTADGSAHRYEHSIEVQLPFVRHLFPQSRLVPIVVPPTESALALGEAIAHVISNRPGRAVCIASTDLTHYGPRYGFTPMGTGSEALQWAADVNDRQFIDLALRLEPERLLCSAVENCSACGPGAAVAAVVAAGRLGATTGLLLAHTTSNDVMLSKMGTTGRDSVGYAAIVF